MTKSAQEKKRLVLLDVHAIVHRAYHALPDFTGPTGEPTGALYGLVAMLLKIITELKPDYIAACYDLPAPTIRHEAYADYKGTRGTTEDALIAQLFNRLSQSNKKHGQPFQLMKGARELLEAAHLKYPLTIVSVRDELSTRRFLDQFDLCSYFQQVVTNQTCEYTKPFPHPVRYAAECMGLSPENCLMVGDTTVDVLAGKAAGAQTVGLLCGFGTEKELRRAGADVILNDLTDLLALINSA